MWTMLLIDCVVNYWLFSWPMVVLSLIMVLCFSILTYVSMRIEWNSNYSSLMAEFKRFGGRFGKGSANYGRLQDDSGPEIAAGS